MKYYIVLCLICLFALQVCYGQTKNSKETSKKQDYSNSFAPYTPEVKENTVSGKKKTNFRKSYIKSLDQKKVEFQKRMIANAKERKRLAKESKKPQYSNPLYFGHKRKPKKRPVGKRKLCKECGIVH